MTIMLFDEKALRKRIDVVYGTMRERAKPKLWKSGKRKGKVRVAGVVGLPFDRDQLWARAVKQVGSGGCPCQYCVAIGRAPNIITLADCVFDHKVPIARGGGWELANLFAICADCNRIKGEASFPFFIALMAAVEKWEVPADRAYFYACMRTHGVTMRLKFQPKGKVETPAAATEAAQPGLPLKEDW